MLYRKIVMALNAQAKNSLQVRIPFGGAYNLHGTSDDSSAVVLPGGEYIYHMVDGDALSLKIARPKKIYEAETIAELDLQVKERSHYIAKDGALTIGYLDKLPPVVPVCTFFSDVFAKAYVSFLFGESNQFPIEHIQVGKDAAKVVCFGIDRNKAGWQAYYNSTVNGNLNSDHRLVVGCSKLGSEWIDEFSYELYYSPISGFLFIADADKLINNGTTDLNIPVGDIEVRFTIDQNTKRISGDVYIPLENVELPIAIKKLLK